MTTVTTTTELKIEAVSTLRPAHEGYTSTAARNFGGGARLVLISVPRVRWLERPIVHVEVRK